MSLALNVGLSLSATSYQRALAILRRYGTDAHVYLPGVGTLNGLTAGNYLDSAGTTAGTVDQPVGLVLDAAGSVDATQSTTASKPILRRGAVNLLLNSATPATQSVTCLAAPYTLALIGTGAVVLSGTGAGTLTGTGASDLVVLNFTPTAGSVTFTKSGTVTSFALFQGTYTAEQIQALGGIPPTTTAAASTAYGPYWWQFDGSNDSLNLGSAPIQTSDDFVIIAGSNYTGPNSPGVFGASTNVDTAELITLAYSLGKPQIYVATGAAAAQVIDASSPTGVHVLSGRKVGTTLVGRMNGVQFGTTSTASVGASAFTAGLIGGYWTSVGLFDGNLGPVIIIKGTVGDSDLLTLERFVGQLSGVTI